MSKYRTLRWIKIGCGKLVIKGLVGGDTYSYKYMYIIVHMYMCVHAYLSLEAFVRSRQYTSVVTNNKTCTQEHKRHSTTHCTTL